MVAGSPGLTPPNGIPPIVCSPPSVEVAGVPKLKPVPTPSKGAPVTGVVAGVGCLMAPPPNKAAVVVGATGLVLASVPL